jgi:hypothetical protein
MDLTSVAVAAVATLGVIAGGLVTYLVARRQSSGKIETSDAATLWKASETIRLEMRQELVAMREQVAELLEKIDRLERRLAQYERLGNG